MPTRYDLAYAAAVALGWPAWAIKGKSRRKVLTALRTRTGRDVPTRTGDGGAIYVHAVSVGEVNATKALVDGLLAARPGLDVTVAVTTDTGLARATTLYGETPGVTVIRAPLDFSASVARTLDARRPTVLVLMELEVWPNLLRACEERGIPAVLANGRLTGRGLSRYRLGGPAMRATFRRLARVLVQDATYADRFAALGVSRDRIAVVGTMKFDTAAALLDAPPPGVDALAASVGLRPGTEPIWVCGSTGPGEEAIALAAYRRLRDEFPSLRLAVVPRKPERFDAVAGGIASAGFPLVRRSESSVPHPVGIERSAPPTAFPTHKAHGLCRGREVRGARDEREALKGNDRPPESDRPSPLPPVVLGDTMGELRAFYALADVAFVGRSLVDLGPSQHGSDMIEPAALGVPVVVGTHTANFAEPMRALRAAGAVVEVPDRAPDQGATVGGLYRAVRDLLLDAPEARQRGRRGREVVRAGRGATRRHLDVLLDLLGPRTGMGTDVGQTRLGGGD